MRRAWILAPLLALAASGCGDPSFAPQTQSAAQTAPGSVFIPPKVDIVLAEDDTGGMSSILTQVNSQAQNFLNSLENQGWDYRFMTVPLTGDRPITQIVASHYDSNWGSSWVAPYPGASSTAGMVLANLFSFPSYYNQFIQPGQINGGLNGMEPAFQNVYNALSVRAPQAQALRADAMLVILVVSNGNDTSGVNYCLRVDGVTVPCETISGSGDHSLTDSFNQYVNAFRSLKPSNSLVKMYSAVSPVTANSYTGVSCMGGNAFIGTRYQQMASMLGGQSYSICSQPISTIFAELQNNLHATKLQFRTRYLFIDRAPQVSTIVVTKFLGGSPGQPVSIPQDATNGWTYAGYLNNVATIDYPTNMNYGSGYAIELHGTAKLVGDDTATVNFTGVTAGSP
jgi:hypothetical protein